MLMNDGDDDDCDEDDEDDGCFHCICPRIVLAQAEGSTATSQDREQFADGPGSSRLVGQRQWPTLARGGSFGISAAGNSCGTR